MQPNSLRRIAAARLTAGFTAIELMVVIAIVATLAAMALPSFRNVIARYQVRQSTEDLSASIYFARGEAIKRGGMVTFRKASATGCTTTGSSDWSCGWLVFADTNEDGVLDPGEQTLQASPLPKNVKVKLIQGTGPSFMNINRWGRSAGLGAFSFEITPNNSTDATLATCLTMASGGRLRMSEGILCP